MYRLDYDCIYSEYDASNEIDSSSRNNDNKKLITEDEAKYLKEINDSVIAYYSNFKVLEEYNVDGEFTMYENYADILSMECMMGIYETKADREKVFAEVSDFFYHDLSDERIKGMLTSNPHTYSRVRVNGMLSNSDGFYETYDIQPRDGMYVAPENRIHVFK